MKNAAERSQAEKAEAGADGVPVPDPVRPVGRAGLFAVAGARKNRAGHGAVYSPSAGGICPAGRAFY